MLFSRPTYVEINLSAIRHNIYQIKKLVRQNVNIMAVVKADAYGHGAVEISKTLENDIDYFAVASYDEAKRLRFENIKSPILILGYTPCDFINKVAEEHLTQTIYDIDILDEYRKKLGNKKLKIHLEVETGMNRLGVSPFSIMDVIKKILKIKNIELEGIFTHFSSADKDVKFTIMQFLKFKNIIDKLKQEKIEILYHHCCNSSAMIRFKNFHLNMVRPGIAIYGLYPFRTKKIDIIPAMTLKSKIISIKEIKKGEKVSYGGDYTAKRKRKIAVVPVGYADGYSRAMSSAFNVLVQGKLVPIIGKVCMDFIIIDVSNIQAKIYDDVILVGKQGNNEITIDDIAKKLNTINYEVCCLLGGRLPRTYIS